MTEREALAQIAVIVGRLVNEFVPQLELSGANTSAMRDDLASIYADMMQPSSPVGDSQQKRSTDDD